MKKSLIKDRGTVEDMRGKAARSVFRPGSKYLPHAVRQAVGEKRSSLILEKVKNYSRDVKTELASEATRNAGEMNANRIFYERQAEERLAREAAKRRSEQEKAGGKRIARREVDNAAGRRSISEAFRKAVGEKGLLSSRRKK